MKWGHKYELGIKHENCLKFNAQKPIPFFQTNVTQQSTVFSQRINICQKYTIVTAMMLND